MPVYPGSCNLSELHSVASTTSSSPHTSRSAPAITSFTLESCSASLLGPLDASPNHSTFQLPTSSVEAEPCGGTTTNAGRPGTARGPAAVGASHAARASESRPASAASERRKRTTPPPADGFGEARPHRFRAIRRRRVRDRYGERREDNR